MDSPKPLLDGGNRKSLGANRLSGSPKTPHVEVISLISTPPSSKSISSPNTTPQMRKNFVADDSPSQSYDYSSPYRHSPDIDCVDVGWDWGDKTSNSRKSREAKKAKEADEERARRQRHLANKIKRSKQKQVREEIKRPPDQNKGFYKFKIEVEKLFQRSLIDDHSFKNCSKSSNEKEDRTKDLSEDINLKSDANNKQKTDLNYENSPSTAKENQPLPGNLLDNSEIDALLLEASQSAEKQLVKTELTENGQKEILRKASETVDNEINSDGDSIDDLLLSISDKELIQLTYSGNSNTTQKGKTSFSRYNSMPPQPQERLSASSTTKCFIRHSSMPPDNAQDSSGLGMATTADQKRICTKEEVEKKKLEAKKRQLLSQQRRLLLNSKNKALVLR